MFGEVLNRDGSPYEAEIGYSRAVVDGDWIFVSGTTGFDYATMTIADDIEQMAATAARAASRSPGSTTTTPRTAA